MKRFLPRATLLLGCIAAALWWAALPVAATDATVGTSDESWYQVAGCASLPCETTDVLPVDPGSLPVPLPTATVNPFSAGTLHVGVVGGQEQARSYIKLDFSSLPFDAQLQGGTLTLPVATDPPAGTVSPETARIQACFMVAAFHGGDSGVLTAPPEPDCTASAPAHLVTQAEAQAFTVDLRSFAERWAGGEPNNGLALLMMKVEEAGAPTETWHVAISGKGSTGPQIKAALNYNRPPPQRPFAPPQFFFNPPPAFIPQAPAAAPPPAFIPQAPAPIAQPVAVTTHGFEYAAIFLLPIAALGLAGLLGYSLTRDVVLPDA